MTEKLQKETNQAKHSSLSLFPHAHNESQDNQPSDCGHHTSEKRCASSLFNLYQTFRRKLACRRNSKRARRTRSFSFVSLTKFFFLLSQKSTVRTKVTKGSPLTFLLLHSSHHIGTPLLHSFTRDQRHRLDCPLSDPGPFSSKQTSQLSPNQLAKRAAAIHERSVDTGSWTGGKRRHEKK